MTAAEQQMPTFEDEFERKLLEASYQLQAKYQGGKISKHAYQHALEALNTTARGLCQEPYILWLDHERSMVGFADDVETVAMYKEDGPMVVMTKERSGDHIRVINHRAAGDTLIKDLTFESEVVPSEAARKQIKALIVGLIKKGYRRAI